MQTNKGVDNEVKYESFKNSFYNRNIHNKHFVFFTKKVDIAREYKPCFRE